MTPTFALAVPHAPWLPGRSASLLRLQRALQRPVSIFADQEPAAAWSERIWRHLESADDVTHGVVLQDDQRAAPNFCAALSALVTAYPDAVIALHSMHPGARTLAREGTHAYTTTDGIVGTGYVIPRSELPAFRGFRELELKPGAQAAVTEDLVLARFCMSTGRRIVSPCPTLIDHDTEIASSAGPEREKQEWRRPSVTWEDLPVLGHEIGDLEKPEFWAPAQHLGTFYPAVHTACLIHCRSFTIADAQAATADRCPAKYGRFLAAHARAK